MVVISLPAHLNRSLGTVVQIEAADLLEYCSGAHVVITLHHIVEQIVADAGTQVETEVPVLPIQT